MSVYKRGKKSRHWHYYMRVRGVRYRGVIPEARTKYEAEQAEIKIKREIFEGRFGQLDLGSEKLADFIEKVFLPWSKANKRSWRQRVSNPYHLRVFRRQNVSRDFAAVG